MGVGNEAEAKRHGKRNGNGDGDPTSHDQDGIDPARQTTHHQGFKRRTAKPEQLA